MIQTRNKQGELTQYEVDDISPQQLLQIWLMASFLYYERDVNVIDDCTFDEISKTLLDEFDYFEHPHKYLIDKQSLAAGTGAFIRETRYPSIVKGAALMWYDDIVQNKPYVPRPAQKKLRRRETNRVNIPDLLTKT